MKDARNLKNTARRIFSETLSRIDAGAAVRGAVEFLDSARLRVAGETIKLFGRQANVYAVAFGKAAYPMAAALDEIIGECLAGGIASGVLPRQPDSKNIFEASRKSIQQKLSGKWQFFAGGHPLPNEASLAAARESIRLLEKANEIPNSLVIFLISGGGSAMLEVPRGGVTLDDLRRANQSLVSCGASIAEINRVRRAFSLIKGGNLASFAPRAAQVSLIISDTEPGDEAAVASGPTIENKETNQPDAKTIIEKYNLTSELPESVLRLVNQKQKQSIEPTHLQHRHFVLLDNQSAISAAAEAAAKRGFTVKKIIGLTEQNVETGCAELLRRTFEFCRQTKNSDAVCLISGGEFACPVRGEGIGGRNSETALRTAILLNEMNKKRGDNNVISAAFLSGGTDGIDGNSPAAGAVCDETTVARAESLGLNAKKYLAESDSYSFFHALDDAVITGATGTNVRDLRIMLAGRFD